MIRLVRGNVDLLDAALAGDDSLARALGHDVVAGWATFTAALPRMRDGLAAAPTGSPWGPRLFVDGEPPELVGWGGFKGPPRDTASLRSVTRSQSPAGTKGSPPPRCGRWSRKPSRPTRSTR